MKIKIKLITTISSLLLISNIIAQDLSLEWVNQIGGEEDVAGYSMTTDLNGHVYVVGRFKGTVDFDPGPDVTEYTSNGGTDIFIKKLDENGNLIWAKFMGGVNFDTGSSIITDSNNNIYVLGFFRETVDFDPGIGTANLTSNGDIDIFIQKMDANGNFLWVRQMGGVGNDASFSITLDSADNIYTTGVFSEIVDFDPGIESMYLTSNGGRDIFIQKLDSDGNFIWVKQMGGTNWDGCNEISIDLFGNIYTTGSFHGIVDFDPGIDTASLTSFGNIDIFILKLDANGDFIWVKQMGGADNDGGISITTDNDGNVYTVGYFNETADLDPSDDVLNFYSNGVRDIFVQKLDVSGNLIWAKHIGSESYDIGSSITTDDEGNIYIAGSFGDIADFDPGVGTTYLSVNGFQDAFFQKLDMNGNLIWVKQLGGIWSTFVSGTDLALDLNNNVYGVGIFNNSIDVFSDSIIEILTSNGANDAFILKLNQLPVSITENTFEENIHVYPNPTIGNFVVSFENFHEELSVRIMSVTGQLIEAKTFHNTNQIQMELDQPNGLYFVELTNEDGKRMVVQLMKE